jgi:hypothetical protein
MFDANWGPGREIGELQGDISYFVYELNYGEHWREGAVTDKKGQSIDMSDSGKLYDYLTREES